MIKGRRFTRFILAFSGFDGNYLPKQENQFVHVVKEELEAFQEKNNHKSVLLFPPLPNRLRYLIHKTVEGVPDLSTFSVGEDMGRRVVTCYSELRLESEGEAEDGNDFGYCEDHPAKTQGDKGEHLKTKPTVPCRNRTPKRPDKPLFMPRAVRNRLSLQSSASEQIDRTSPEAPFSSLSQLKAGAADQVTVDCTSNPECPIEEMTPNMDLSVGENLVLEETRSNLAELCLEPDTNEDPADEARSPETEDSVKETLDLLHLVKINLKEGENVSIEHAHNDYSVYENVSLNSDDFLHVIEIYDFPQFFKTEDLFDAFTEYSGGGMKIKWVDNTHALGVFSCEKAAQHALSISHPLLKARPLSRGSRKAKGKAIRRAEFLQPVKERPKTDTAVARRMVTRALGVRGRGKVHRY